MEQLDGREKPDVTALLQVSTEKKERKKKRDGKSLFRFSVKQRGLLCDEAEPYADSQLLLLNLRVLSCCGLDRLCERTLEFEDELATRFEAGRKAEDGTESKPKAVSLSTFRTNRHLPLSRCFQCHSAASFIGHNDDGK